MTAILRNESEKLVRGSFLLTGLFALLSVFFFAAFPGFAEQAELVEDAFPAFLMGLLGFEELHTIEGFVGGYIYPLVWIVFAGIYFSYVSAGMIAGDIQNRRMDLTLSNPVSRESVLLQKVAALWVPLVVLNAGLVIIVSAGATVLGETVDPVSLAMVHVLSVPYLLVCAGIGILLSVVLERVETAQAVGPGLVFVLWLVDGFGGLDEEYEWLGTVAPSRYFDPSEILVHEEYAFLDAGILVGGFLALLGAAVLIFVRRDI